MCWLIRWIAQADPKQRTWEAACVREFIPLLLFLVMALHFSFKIMVLFHAAKRVEIKKKRVSLYYCISETRLKTDIWCTDWLGRINPAISLHICYWLPKKEHYLSSPHHCVEGSTFFIKVCQQSIVLYHSCLTGGADGNHVFQMFPACAALPELTSVCHFCSYTVNRKLTLATIAAYWQISIN